MGNYDFPDHIKGDSFSGQRFTILVNGVPLNLTNATIKMDLRGQANLATYALRFMTSDNTIQIVDAANGVFEVRPRIIDIAPKTYFYDIEITLQDGTVKTYISGTWNIVQDITHG